MAFRDGLSDDWAWSGALMLSDSMDDLAKVRAFVEGVSKVRKPKK